MDGSDYTALADEQIIALIRGGDSGAIDFIIERYKNTAKIKARAYYLIGADNDDIIQEGMIGLYKAIRDFDPDKSPVFARFAELCIQRQILSAIKTAARKKHMPLNKYISFDSPCEQYGGDGEKTFSEIFIAEGITNPEDIFIGKESMNYIEAAIQNSLSSLEKSVLSLFLDGKSYSEIAAVIQREEKTVDNSLQRVRRKVNRILRDRG